MTGLVSELQNDIINNKKLSDILRKSFLISKKLDIIENVEWLKKELDGYNSDDIIPIYRIIKGEVRIGNFPVSFRTTEDLDYYSEIKIFKPVGELEFLIMGGERMLTMQISPEKQNSLMQHTKSKLPLHLAINKAEFSGILDAVKNEIMYWSSELEKNGIFGEGLLFSNEEKEKAHNIPLQINIINNNESKAMNDKNINTNITGSTVHGSVVTAETLKKSFNSIQNLPPEHDELKVLLSQLQTLINTSPLSETAKQKALSKTQDIAEATQQPEAEQQNSVQKTLGYFDGLADSLESGTETAIKLGETVAGIASLFGL